MKTTLNIDHQLANEAKQVALNEGVTLTTVINTALRDYLKSKRQQGIRTTINFELKTKTGKGLKPGIDLDDRDSLYDRMENR